TPSYTWTGAGIISNTHTNNPTVTNASGDYTITVNNACGTASSVVTTTILPAPSVSVSGATLCTGDVATLTPSGSTTYSINGVGVAGTTFTYNPGSTTSYSFTSQAVNGCLSNIAVATVSVNSYPTVSVNDVTICSGKTATFVPSGAATYSVNGVAKN